MVSYFKPIFPAEDAPFLTNSEAIALNESNDWDPPLSIKGIISNIPEIFVDELMPPSPKKLKMIGFQSKACKENGNAAENLFLKLAQSKNWRNKIIKERELYDFRHHVDFMFKLPEPSQEEVWVDVKSMRSLKRGFPPQSKYMWVELHDRGWLMGGKATMIAQQITHEGAFALFDKNALAEYVKTKVQTNKNVVHSAAQSFERVYIRESPSAFGKGTYITALSLIDTKDAFNICGCGTLLPTFADS